MNLGGLGQGARPSTSGGVPVGFPAIFPTPSNVGASPTIALSDGSVWLRRNIFARASLYPRLAAIPQYQVTGFADPAAVVTMGANQGLFPTGAMWCHDSARNITIAASNTPGGIVRTADGGATWQHITISANTTILGLTLTSTPTFVAMVKDSGGTVTLAYSANGTTWTPGALVSSGDSFLNGYAQGIGVHRSSLTWTGSAVVGVYAIGVSASAIGLATFRSTTNGATIVNKQTIFTSTTAAMHMSIDSDGAGNVVLAVQDQGNAGLAYVSTDSGLTWASATSGITYSGYGSGFVNFGCACIAGRAYISVSSNGASGRTWVIPNLAAPGTATEITSALTSDAWGTSNMGGGNMLKLPNGELWVLSGQGIIGPAALRINTTTLTVDARRNLLRTYFVPTGSRIYAPGTSAGSNDIGVIGTTMTATDSVGFYGESFAYANQTQCLGSTYVRAA